MANPLIDQITHPGNDEEFPLDADVVVDAAAASQRDPRAQQPQLRPREFACELLGARTPLRAPRPTRPAAPVSIGSDAHYALHVGTFEAAIAIAEEFGFAEERIVNRDAAAVLAHLRAKRERPRLDIGGVWEWPASTRDGARRGSRKDPRESTTARFRR